MSGQHLKKLIRAHRDGDELAFRRTVQEIIQEEEDKRHLTLARELSQLLASGASAPIGDWVPAPLPPRTSDGDAELMHLSSPKRLLSSLTLAAEVAAKLEELIREVSAWPVLDLHGIPRRQSILLHGPPGCGKSSVAAALAGQLGCRLGTVRVDAVVSSYLGETASNLRRVFDFATANSIVLLLDEFDALGRERNDPNDHGELRRVVNAVLQLLESYSGPSLIVATSNHSRDLDSAVWRRFELVVELPPPSTEQLVEVLRRTLGSAVSPALDLRSAATSLSGYPHAAAEAAAWEARRSSVMAGRKRVNRADLEVALSSVRTRRWS